MSACQEWDVVACCKANITATTTPFHFGYQSHRLCNG